MWKFLKKVVRYVAAAVVAFIAVPAFAAIDISVALLGVTDAGVAILAVIGALMALTAAIFGIVKVYNFLSKKAGA